MFRNCAFNEPSGLLLVCDVTTVQTPPSTIAPTWLWFEKHQLGLFRKGVALKWLTFF